MNDIFVNLDKDRDRRITLDIVIPVFNEEAVIDHLFDRLYKIFSREKCEERGIEAVNYIVVDDGSSDAGAVMIYNRIQAGEPITLLRFSRNFGHQAAVCAGFAESGADVAAVIDADLQDPPELILEMVDLWRKGWDVVYAQRKRRRENFIKVFCYWAFYRLLGLLTDIKVPLDAGDFSLMDSNVVKALNAMPEVLRFPRGLRAWVGFRQTGIQYDRPRREFGRTKYNFKKLYALATDGIASLSIRPLRFTQFSSFLMSMISLITLAVLLWSYLFNPGSGINFGLMVLIFCILITSSMQLFGLYILGAYVGRTYLEVKKRPTYIIKQKISNKEDPEN